MLLTFLQGAADALWGTPMTVVLVGMGLYLSLRFRFYYNFRHWGFHFRNTFGKMFQKGEGHGTVSGFAAACTAMANTIGVGNIGGVATAIVSGGPGAVFWMWVSGCLGMSTKACEIILGQRFRVKYSKSMDEYMCDRSFVMKNALGWKRGALLLSVACFTLGPWTCSVQTESVVGALKEAFGIQPVYAAAFLGITCFATIFGGLQRISRVMERVVPVMALLYILGGVAILLQNWQEVPGALALIVRSAFSPMAAAGGFAGATVKDAMRYGIARGLYSNDAGTGYGIIAHASARTDHPVRQASWGWGEVFLDTIVVCSVTALSLILTHAYTDFPGLDSARLTTAAFRVSFGEPGAWFLALAITVFAWTTIIGMYYSCEKSVNYAFGDTRRNRIGTRLYMFYYMIPCVVLYHAKADALWAMTDILSAIYVMITILFIVTQQKEIFRLFDDFWFRFLPAKERGENPPVVSYGTVEDERRVKSAE
ncbi:MAG: amino acid carrier protein [Acidaminococcus fermentans]|nr:amino acid carrier protein [Acidaminococcus fermentans]MDD6287215.1 amino acid carrier protein [Acidaminococcus fermentans]